MSPLSIRRRIVPFVLLLLAPSALPADQTGPYALLQQGRIEEATARLHDMLVASPRDAEAHQLLCRSFYAQDMADPAIEQCEAAVADDASSSDNQMWLARAYGLKAQHANPIAALSLARKVHAAFERAVALDPNNAQALSDLGEYYVEAPALIGGGLDRAHALAARMMPSFPARAHRLLAMAAEKNNDLPTAEAEYQNAVAAEKSPAAYIDLGNFYAHHNQHDKMLAALQNGIDADHRRDSSLVDAASILASAHAEPQLAESLLRRYLASPAKSDDAPAFKVHLQLGFILAARGDQPDAQREFSAAHALAPDYAPARKAVEGS